MSDDSPPHSSAAVPGASSGDSAPHLRSIGSDTYGSWRAIYLDNVERIYRIMYAHVGNRSDAEDLTSEVFQAALKPLRVSASIGEVRAYLLATARTVLAAHWRRHYALEITAIDLDKEREQMSVSLPESDAPQRVDALLAELPDRYAEILRLRFLDACSLKETARAMNISIGNAKVLQHRALQRAAATHGGEP
jgi:RNA polymerase sigma-70 factor (ECF subfamily)